MTACFFIAGMGESDDACGRRLQPCLGVACFRETSLSETPGSRGWEGREGCCNNEGAAKERGNEGSGRWQTAVYDDVL